MVCISIAGGSAGHLDLERLIGPEVYRRSPAELTEGHYLAQYKELRINIALSSEDEARYAENRLIFRSFLQCRHIVIRSPEEFQQKIIFLSARDPEARTAMLAWREVRNIAMNTPAKYVEIERLLRLHASDKIILYRIADQPSSQRSLQGRLRIASIALF